MNYISYTRKAIPYYWENGVACYDFGTRGGATFYIMFKARRKDARPHIWAVWKNCNNSDYVALKNLVSAPEKINPRYDFYIR